MPNKGHADAELRGLDEEAFGLVDRERLGIVVAKEVLASRSVACTSDVVQMDEPSGRLKPWDLCGVDSEGAIQEHPEPPAVHDHICGDGGAQLQGPDVVV